VHNLGRLDGSGSGAVSPWAAAADAWIAERIEAGQVDALLDYPVRLPGARLAAPTTEHLDPVFFALGAAAEGDRVQTLFSGFTFGSLSMRTFALQA
jgi:4,5-DOPA dioxygenase extradiol